MGNSAGQTRRRESIQRIQVGLTGLAGIVMLIGLVNIVVDNVRTLDPASAEMVTAGNVQNGVDAAPSEPLAELGVAPAVETDGALVPDLRPDPRLHERMDREPAQPATR